MRKLRLLVQRRGNLAISLIGSFSTSLEVRGAITGGSVGDGGEDVGGATLAEPSPESEGLWGVGDAGASFTGVTVSETVAVLESRLPSLTLKAKLSEPL